MAPIIPNTQAKLSAFSAATDHAEAIPTYDERALHLGVAQDALSHLSGLDWSFTDDDTRFLAHDLHPYPAKFIPQLPGTLTSLLSSRGDVVFDPFGGSGTTALEAIRLGRRAVSLDANPVAALIGKVKTARVTPEAVAELHALHASLRAMGGTLSSDPRTLVDTYGYAAPNIPNREKWFPDSSFGELAYIRARIQRMNEEAARNIAYLALSRSVLSSSFQDSETRYKSVPRLIPVGETINRYIREFEAVMRSVARNASATRYGVSQFITADVRALTASDVPDGSIDLVVTSPPYGNAMDYHLYHRFRLFWLGYDPVAFGAVEIGSHLKHQRQASGFNSYLEDMLVALGQINRVLKNGRYAALVIGDSIYDGELYETARLLQERATALGFDESTVIERKVHSTKRSFVAGRRAINESILVLRKAARPTSVLLELPPYKLWPYERDLRVQERGTADPSQPIELDVSGMARSRAMVFTHQIVHPSGFKEPTWQAIIENGMASNPAARKDPKYVTHGLHPYKVVFGVSIDMVS